MKINLKTVGIMEENTYFVTDELTGDTIVIDPGSEVDNLIDFINENNFNLKYIVLTHAHFDHIGACQGIKDYFNVPIIYGQGEQLLLEHPENNLSSSYGEPISIKGDLLLDDEQIFNINDNLSFKALKTPGHTPGGICIYFEKYNVVFTGDTLFYGTIGRTDFPYGDSKQLINSLEKLKSLPDDTIVYPGHGENTSIGMEKSINIYMQ